MYHHMMLQQYAIMIFVSPMTHCLTSVISTATSITSPRPIDQSCHPAVLLALTHADTQIISIEIMHGKCRRQPRSDFFGAGDDDAIDCTWTSRYHSSALVVTHSIRLLYHKVDQYIIAQSCYIKVLVCSVC